MNRLPTGAQPPQFVIRATTSYKASHPVELSFREGDFFHVTDTSKEGVYTVSDPVRGVRGQVPRGRFQVLERTHHSGGGGGHAPNGGARGGSGPGTGGQGQNGTHVNGASSRVAQPPTYSQSFSHASQPPPSTSKRPASLMATVMYDFTQEKVDELPARAGDSIVVLARSNHDWVLGKPTGKIARPGLIPVTYIEVRHPRTGKVIPTDDIKSNQIGLPSVQEWKTMTRKHLDNIIPLGVLSTSNTNTGTAHATGAGMKQQGPKSADLHAEAERDRRDKGAPGRNVNSQPLAMTNGLMTSLSQPSAGTPNGKQPNGMSSQQYDQAGSHNHNQMNGHAHARNGDMDWELSQGERGSRDSRAPQRRGSSMARDTFGNALKGGGSKLNGNPASRSPQPAEPRNNLSQSDAYTTYHSVGIRRYELQSDGSYLFHLRLFVTAPSEQGTITTERMLYRYYEDFHQLHMELMQQFPREAGRQQSSGTNASSLRTLPFLPKPTAYVDEDVTRSRMLDLDTYLKQLVVMPAHVVRSETVDDFLNTWDWDEELTRDGRQIATLIAEAQEEERQARLHPPSQTGLDTRPVGPPSPPRSTASPGMGGNPGTHSMSSASSGSNASRDWGSYFGSGAAAASRGQNASNHNSTQQPSPTSSRGSNGLHSIFNTSSSNVSSTMLKIKVEYNDDMVALKADPNTLTLPWLHSTIAEKLFGTRDYTGFRMYVQVDGEWEPIEDEEALQEGVRECGGKLIVHVRL